MATKRNIGAAQPQPQISTITIANTWAPNDTISVTVDKKTITMTLGITMNTTTEVAEGLKEVLNLSTHDPAAISADCTVDFGGYEFPEFRDMVATVASSVVTCTSVGAVPFTMSVSVSTAGSGSAAYAVATAASGPNFFMGNDNWEGGAEPVADDTVIFDGASASILYGLDHGLADLNITCTKEYSGNIGLPKINSRGYTEYRQRFLDAPVTTTSGAQVVSIDGTGRRLIDFGTAADSSNTLAVTVASSSAVTSDGPSVQIVGGKNIVFISQGTGSISLSDHQGENASHFDSIKNLGVCDVTVGSSATFKNAANTVEHNGGTLDWDAICNGASTEFMIYDGVFIARENAFLVDYNQFGGRCDWRGSAIGYPVLYGGTFDGSKGTGATITGGFKMFRGVTFIDPNGVFTDTTIGLVGCNLGDVDLRLKDNLTLEFSVTSSPTLV